MDYQVVYNEERLAIAKGLKRELHLSKPYAPRSSVIFYRTGDCDARCRSLLNPLLESGAHGYLHYGHTRPKRCICLGTKAGIAPERVSKKEITLNFETGILTNLPNARCAGGCAGGLLAPGRSLRKSAVLSHTTVETMKRACLLFSFPVAVVAALNAPQCLANVIPATAPNSSIIPSAYVQVANDYGIPPAVFYSVMMQESTKNNPTHR